VRSRRAEHLSDCLVPGRVDDPRGSRVPIANDRSCRGVGGRPLDQTDENRLSGRRIDRPNPVAGDRERVLPVPVARMAHALGVDETQPVRVPVPVAVEHRRRDDARRFRVRCRRSRRRDGGRHHDGYRSDSQLAHVHWRSPAAALSVPVIVFSSFTRLVFRAKVRLRPLSVIGGGYPSSGAALPNV
jgi:hypothetical protein